MSPIPGPVVSLAWLNDHQDDPDLVILDASIARSVDEDGQSRFGPGHPVFAAEHIARARFADLYSAFSDPTSPYPFTRPTLAQVEVALTSVGVGAASTVVIYDQLSGAYAARLWLVLRSFGLERVAVLDGGYAAWLAHGGETASGGAAPAPAPDSPVELSADSGVFVGLDTVVGIALAGPADVPADDPADDQERSAPVAPALVCALRTPEYVGDPARPGSGHIPSSVSVPFPDLLDSQGRYDVAAIRDRAARAGLDGEVIAYCGGGVNAAGLALAFLHAGFALPRVFDGSLSEWRAQPDLPLVTGPAAR